MEAASYSNPIRSTYSFGLLAFTAALTTLITPPPPCAAGRVVDIHVRSTITFTNTTTAALVQIGNTGSGAISGAACYAQLALGVAAAGGSWNFVATGGSPYSEKNAGINSDINFQRDGVTAVQVKIVPMTGGTPAGTGYLDISFAWY